MAFQSVRDSRTDFLENTVWDFRVACRHSINAANRSHNDGFTVYACIPVNTDTTHWEQCCKILPREFHFTSFSSHLKLFFHNGACLSASLCPLPCEISQNADGQSRAWEWLPVATRNIQQFSHVSDFIFVKFSKGFDNCQIHIIGQTSDVVMTLDDISLTTTRFNPIGSDCTLN